MVKKSKGKKASSGGKWLKVLLLSGIVLLFAAGITGRQIFKTVFGPNVKPTLEVSKIAIPTGADYAQVMDILRKNDLLTDWETFDWVAKAMKYPDLVKPGLYYLKPDMSNRELIAMLRSGAQKPVKVVIGKYRVKEKLAAYIASRLEVDSAAFHYLLNDDVFLRKYGLNSDNSLAIFLPDTYEFYWNTDARGIFERMMTEYRKFWDEDRNAKAQAINLTRLETIIVASIVEEETNKKDEMPTIAGVYLNRIRKNWKLQADPTVKFAMKNFEIKRVLTVHTETDSPYNTYKYSGLPPGPICIPSKAAIDAVLNHETHDYMYFCAKDDFSGYHSFSKTLTEHNKHAKNFHAALNKKKIFE